MNPRARYCRRAARAAGLVLALAYAASGALASTDGAGTYAGSFLRIPVGSEAMSVPDVVSGMTPDPSMAFSNPAGLGRVGGSQVFFTAAQWLEDLNLSAGSAVFPVGIWGMRGALAARLLYSGGLQGYSPSGVVVAEENYYDLSVSASAAKTFDMGLSLGLGIAYLREHAATETGRGITYSIGASYWRGPHRLEAFASDLGGDLAFAGRDYPIAARYAVGYGYAFSRPWGLLDLGTQFVAYGPDSRLLQLGAAYDFGRHFILRSGFGHSFASTTTQTPITAGLGFHYGMMSLDYAYTSQEYFPASHTFSMTFALGGRGPVRQGPQTPSPGAVGAQQALGGSQPENRAQTGAETRKSPVEKAVGSPPARIPTFVIVAGSHSRWESARAEVRALELLGVSASAERNGQMVRVVVARCQSMEEANRLVMKHARKGHRFSVVTE